MRTKLISVVIALLASMSVWADEIQAVDLGLPSGIKWASCNVGAEKPEDYGNYYAWGEVTTKDDYSWETYKYGSYKALTKYCNDASYGNNGFTDDKTTLDLEDDAAHVNWDGTWRMPTSAEMDELLNNCTWTWTTQNEVNGYQVTSKTNSNSIFLPAAGYRDGTSTRNVGSDGLYWSSPLDEYRPFRAWSLGFYSDYLNGANTSRNYGYSVRPVCPKHSTAIVSIVSAADTTPQKILIDGQVHILRNGMTYTLTGVEVK